MNQIKELKLNNDNNCLECNAFVKLNVAPEQKLIEKDFDIVYLVKHNGKDIYVKMVDILIVDFSFVGVCSLITLPATGMVASEWRQMWLSKFPDTKDEKKMAVYYYKKQV